MALALISSLKDTPVGEGIVAFGEIGLAGELRGVSNAEARVHEAARLGFTRILVPRHNLSSLKDVGGIEVVGVGDVREAYAALN